MRPNAAELPPGRGDGAPVSSPVDVQGGAQVRHMIVAKPESKLLVASTGGYGFIARFGDLLAKKRGGKEFMTLEEGEEPLPPFLFDAAPGNYIAAVSEQGRLLLFSIAEMRELARGRGVIVMGLEQNEKLVSVAVSDQQKLTVLGTGRGGREKTVTISGEGLAHHAGHRARMGRVIADKIKPSRLMVVAEAKPVGA